MLHFTICWRRLRIIISGTGDVAEIYTIVCQQTYKYDFSSETLVGIGAACIACGILLLGYVTLGAKIDTLCFAV